MPEGVQARSKVLHSPTADGQVELAAELVQREVEQRFAQVSSAEKNSEERLGPL